MTTIIIPTKPRRNKHMPKNMPPKHKIVLSHVHSDTRRSPRTQCRTSCNQIKRALRNKTKAKHQTHPPKKYIGHWEQDSRQVAQQGFVAPPRPILHAATHRQSRVVKRCQIIPSQDIFHWFLIPRAGMRKGITPTGRSSRELVLQPSRDARIISIVPIDPRHCIAGVPHPSIHSSCRPFLSGALHKLSTRNATKPRHSEPIGRCLVVLLFGIFKKGEAETSEPPRP
jgi:hypothetical protein